ncbi:protein C1orf43-like isoform X1 [Brachionichthys hirsutus]|uniref:protein C1orf43-like isoform X1 n=1 Tax=Brachionichthys hirsutus TaxID=412623 RepID=UPI003604CFF7
MGESYPLSGVNVVLVMAYGSLVFVLLFIFVKRQIMRFAMRSRRGPHAPIGHNAPKGLKEEIDSRLSRVQEICFEPRLLSEEDDRLEQGSQISCFNYLYRMKALDAIRDSGRRSRFIRCFTGSHFVPRPRPVSSVPSRLCLPGLPLQEISRSPSAFTGRGFRSWLLEVRNSHSLIKSSRGVLIDRLLDGYDRARHGTGAFGEAEFLGYQRALGELADVVKAYSSTTSLDQHHQSAAKGLTGSPSRSPPSTIQVTYLPSTCQRSKRPKHFLELKSFKDNYNTLESTL